MISTHATMFYNRSNNARSSQLRQIVSCLSEFVSLNMYIHTVQYSLKNLKIDSFKKFIKIIVFLDELIELTVLIVTRKMLEKTRNKKYRR